MSLSIVVALSLLGLGLSLPLVSLPRLVRSIAPRPPLLVSWILLNHVTGRNILTDRFNAEYIDTVTHTVAINTFVEKISVEKLKMDESQTKYINPLPQKKAIVKYKARLAQSKTTR